MSESQTRGRWHVNRDSWMWRWYAQWAARKHDNRSLVDLCHFVRVLLIFGPWRWFWQARYTRLQIEPFLFVGVTAIVAALVFLFTKFTYVAGVIALIALTVLVAAAIVGSLIYLVFRLAVRNPAKADAIAERTLIVLKWAFVWLWGPIYLLLLGAEWLWYRAIAPAGERVFGKPLFHVSVRDQLIGVWIYPLLFIALYAGLVMLVGWEWVLGITGAVVLGAIALAALIAAGLLVRKWANTFLTMRADEWAALPEDEKQRRLEKKRAKKQREWHFAKLLWAWLVAKKHRICPIIEPTSTSLDPPDYTPYA